MWRIFSSNTYVEIIEKLKTVGVVFLPAHLTILAWVFSDFFFWLTTKCPHALPKCEQLSYQYIWHTLATYNKSCEWCEVKKTNFPTRALWTVFRPIIADGKPSCPWLVIAAGIHTLNISTLQTRNKHKWLIKWTDGSSHADVWCTWILLQLVIAAGIHTSNTNTLQTRNTRLMKWTDGSSCFDV